MPKKPDKYGDFPLALSEFDLIEKYLEPLSPSGAPAFGLSNDAAVYQPGPGKELVFTKDTLVAGIHFFTDDPAGLIAQKALRVNLSDLAAMGALPKGYLLSLSIPKENFDPEAWVKDFSSGLKEDQDEFDCHLWGGDTVSTTGPVTISITGIGEVEKGRYASRSGAKVDDYMYVSGNLGDSAVGLRVLKGDVDHAERDYFVRKYHLPEPRIALGIALVPYVSAMMDVSDGLMGDIAHIAKHSNVGATINDAIIPVSEPFGNLLETKSDYSPLKWCGGDDYELLFTAPEKNEELISDVAERFGVKVTKIGRITAGNEISLIDGDGSVIDIGTKEGFRHF